MSSYDHIPHLKSITDFYQQLQIGQPQGDDFAIMRIEDQPASKRMEMPLFRCNFFRIVYFTNPGVAFSLPHQQLESSENSIYFSYPGKLESWYTSQKIYGYLICFTDEFAQIDKHHSSFDQQFPFFNFSALSLIHFDTDIAQNLQPILEKMLQEIKGEALDRMEMLRYQLHQYMILLRRIYREKESNLSPSVRNNVKLYHQFRQVLDDYFAALANGQESRQASVQAMANRLHLNASYLNTVIKNLTGNTASSYIHKKTILEAKSYLLHTDLQVAEISFRLGFTNVTYFNRFFKRLTDTTPLSFRKSSHL